ncbi:DUF1501 domain-containing protein [Tepidiforma sp.]|uniref:DUF1501 domain-containing protein n=1 Tax=Tepidiforma sp. TaxID=2682230 RepID=UPI002ADD6C9E|nr:DUF1501 domain-containing protein [Tepidiforma sp.]
MTISRRDVIKGGIALVSIGTTAQSLLKGAVAFAAAQENAVNPAGAGKILILVQLAGGNDGLNTVVPAASGTYRSARRTLALAEDEVLPLGEGFGLHPGLKGLKQAWDAGRLAIVQGVGYPNQDYSHFKSMAIWQAGDPELKLRDGWLGRALEKLESSEHDPFLGFNIGNSTPPELQTPAVSVPSVTDPSDYAFKVRGTAADMREPRTATLLRLYEEYPAQSPYGVLLETTAETAVASSAALAEAGKRYQPAVPYPETSFGAGLSLMAEAIVGGLGVRVGHVTLGGFDTHTNQAEDHAELMAALDAGLSAFLADLEAHGRADDVLVLTWSEFGRRVAENANGGTDHGAGSVMFALGTQVRGGLYGETPSLERLVDNGNLGYTTDFRRVYATVLDGWLGVPHEELLGSRWDSLGFVTL